MNRWRGTSERREALSDGHRPRRLLRRLLLVAHARDVRRRPRQPHGDARARRPDRDREEPAVGAAPDPAARRRCSSWPRSTRSPREAVRRMLDAWRTTRRHDHGPARSAGTRRRPTPVARSSPPPAPACSPTATRTCRPGASPRRPASRSARSTTTSAQAGSSSWRVLEAENARLLERQRAMFGGPEPLWRQWERACDFLDEDLAVGLRPDPPGDDRGRLVRPRGRGRRSASMTERLVSRCWPRSPSARSSGSAASGRSRPAEVGGPDGHCRSWAPRQLILLGVPEVGVCRPLRPAQDRPVLDPDARGRDGRR